MTSYASPRGKPRRSSRWAANHAPTNSAARATTPAVGIPTGPAKKRIGNTAVQPTTCGDFVFVMRLPALHAPRARARYARLRASRSAPQAPYLLVTVTERATSLPSCLT